jgi:hypothetical protein
MDRDCHTPEYLAFQITAGHLFGEIRGQYRAGRELPRCSSKPELGAVQVQVQILQREKVPGQHGTCSHSSGPERRALSGLTPPASRAPEDRF